MEDLTTEYLATDGVRYKIRTLRQVNETDAEFEARHDAFVVLFKTSKAQVGT